VGQAYGKASQALWAVPGQVAASIAPPAYVSANVALGNVILNAVGLGGSPKNAQEAQAGATAANAGISENPPGAGISKGQGSGGGTSYAGDQPVHLTRADLADAARWTGAAIFQYGERPDVISVDVALQLPFNPSSNEGKKVLQEKYGVDGFKDVQSFLGAIGYKQDPLNPNRWIAQDPSGASAGGPGSYYTPPTSYGYYFGGGGYGGGSGGYGSSSMGLTNWRIGY
jgi:hypothetical protein